MGPSYIPLPSGLKKHYRMIHLSIVEVRHGHNPIGLAESATAFPVAVD